MEGGGVGGSGVETIVSGDGGGGGHVVAAAAAADGATQESCVRVCYTGRRRRRSK